MSKKAFGNIQNIITKDTLEIYLVGDLSGAQCPALLSQTFENSGLRKVLISMKQVLRIDSATLNTIVDIYKKVGVGLVICQIPSSFANMLNSLRFDKYIALEKDLDDARDYLKKLVLPEIVPEPHCSEEEPLAFCCAKENQVLINALASPEPLIRSNAVETIGKLGIKDALPQLKALLDDPDKGVIMATVEAVEKLAEPSLLPELMKLAEKDDDWIKGAVAHALGLLGGQESLETLENLMNSSNKLVSRNALMAKKLVVARMSQESVAEKPN